MIDESPLPTYIAYKVEYLDDCELIDWGIKYLPTSKHFGDDLDLIKLVSINTKNISEVKKAGYFLSNFIGRQWPEFDLKGNESEFYAKNFFHQRMQQYLEGECSPYDICKMICPIERLFDFPYWLGNMFNACDWIEPETKPVDCKHLAIEIEQALKL